MSKQKEISSDPDAEANEMTLWQTTQSVLYAMLGVQKAKNAKRDFSKGNASHFIIIGILFGVSFVIVLALLVRFILNQVGAS